jgi:hypothetical protein
MGRFIDTPILNIYISAGKTGRTNKGKFRNGDGTLWDLPHLSTADLLNYGAW